MTRTSLRAWSTTRRVGALALTLLAAVVITGCQPVQAGAAAVVGSERISTEELQGTVEVVVAEQQGQAAPDEGQLQRATLSRMIVGLVIDEAARREGVTVTSGEVDTRIDQVRASVGGGQRLRQALLQDGILPGDLPSLVEQSIAAEKIGQALVPGNTPNAQLERRDKTSALLQDVSRDLDIEVSPRYGRWNAARAAIVPASDELSTPASSSGGGPGAPGTPQGG